MLQVLTGMSVFGFAALLVAACMGYAQQNDGRRPDADTKDVDAQLARFGASYTVNGMRQGALLSGALACVVIFLLSQNIVFAMLPLVVGVVVPFAYPGWVRSGYFKRFENDFAECLDIWTRCLQSGLSFQQAIETASHDMSGPVQIEMEILRKEMSLGDVEAALWHLYERVPLGDVRYAVLGVVTCRQTGGKMSEVMAKIGAAIRERVAQRERIQAITSMGRTEAYVMAVMPFGIGCMMYILQPDSIETLFNTWLGIIGTLLAILWEAFGLVIIWKIVDVKE